MSNRELGIYIHIPFCKRKCYYCDFISYENKYKMIYEYIESLIKEINLFDFSKYNVTSIYIGGGTPSYLESNYIEKIIKTLKNKIDFKDVEVTIEINPGTVTKEKLLGYKNIGINRVSIGLQSTNNKLLKTIGRIHTYEDFLKVYNWLNEIGIDNVNVDLMLGLPNQTIQDLKDSLNKIISLNPNHISVYSLILEEGTKLEQMVKKEELKLPDEEIERNMYWYVKNTLELNGYNHYEISNFSKKKKESRHNLNCWNQEEYIGFGVAAHSYINNVRFSNTSDIENYIYNINNNIEKNNIKVEEKQTLDDKKKEYMMLGLRKIEGVSISDFKEKFIDNPIFIYKNILNKLVNEDLIQIDLNYIKLTNKGLDFANLVFEEFI